MITYAGVIPETITALEKGIPAGTKVSAGDVTRLGWSLLAEDLHLPLLVLKESAIDHNLREMARWCAGQNILLAPHGKTTMCPRLYRRQLEHGAWGITVATASQALVCAGAGVERVLVANQIVGKANVASVAAALAANPRLEIFCLADSAAGVEHLARHLAEAGSPRPVKVFVEWGHRGWRGGVRSMEDGRRVHQAIRARPKELEFAGVEGFEGLAQAEDGSSEADQVREFLAGMLALARDLAGGAGSQSLLFSAGGSAYLDLVAEAFARIETPYRALLRSGCYVTHDHGIYVRKHASARVRSGPSAVPEFRPALELWAYVQSIPDPNRAILTFGKRDCSFDADLPEPLWALSPGEPLERARPLGGTRVTGTNDQHAFLEFPDGVRLGFGDRVVCGISHPCTAIDKWRVLPLVDDSYRVLDLYRTFF
jgi:D-serine dehydratase